MKSGDLIEAIAKEANVDAGTANKVLAAIGLDADLVGRMRQQNVKLGKLRTALKALGEVAV
ncbi:hypothetical protein [Rhizobium johnstonii]|uniref:hypothetical protein n=1 Tax=Rhizobium johnstonii TaxID=3019933 RepID=UPI003F9B00F0